MEIRNASRENAGDLAYLINLAGEGIPEYLWQGMVEGGESALDVGARRATKEASATPRPGSASPTARCWE